MPEVSPPLVEGGWEEWGVESDSTLVLEQGALRLDPSGESAESTLCGDDPMAWDPQGDRIATARASGGPRPPGGADLRCELGVGPRLATRDLRDTLPHGSLKRGTDLESDLRTPAVRFPRLVAAQIRDHLTHRAGVVALGGEPASREYGPGLVWREIEAGGDQDAISGEQGDGESSSSQNEPERVEAEHGIPLQRATAVDAPRPGEDDPLPMEREHAPSPEAGLGSEGADLPSMPVGDAFAVRISHLSKVFQDERSREEIVAVRNLDLQIRHGQIYGLIGPNGAGKSTLMRIVATLLAPSFGSVEVCGHDSFTEREEVCRKLGFMPELFNLYEELTVEEYLDFFAAAYGVPRERRARVIDDVIELTDLGVRRKSLSGTLSKGMRQRLLLAKTLIHDPEVLILDEPTSGMDPQARIEFRNIVRTLARMGKTIIISSHILPDLSSICTAFGIMERGSMRVSGTFEEVAGALRMTAKVEIGFLSAPQTVFAFLDRIPEAIAPKLGDGKVEFGFEGDEAALAELLRRFVNEGITVTRFVRRECDLEEIFLQIGADRVQ